MRITVVSAGDITDDFAAPPLVHTLVAAGHDVSLVAARGSGQVAGVPVLTPQERRRWWPFSRRSRDPAERLAATIEDTNPEIIHPLRSRDLTSALGADGALVARDVEWDLPPDRDLIAQAPHHPEVSQPAARSALEYFTPADDRPSRHPSSGRHAGIEIAIVYRHTDTSPGRYLETALERSGATVRSFDGAIDWSTVDRKTAAVVFVESPYPAMEVIGDNPGIPVLFWVHHGEHHLAANLRLAARYGADAVLLAHSWHLAHRFPVAVHRFPFAVPPELFPETPRELADRSYAVAMVGAGVESPSTRYAVRYRRVEELNHRFGDRAAFRSHISPADMAALYGDAMVVINDGGARHHPITMRVFEAIGAGALLATDPSPGADLLFTPDEHYVELTSNVAAHVAGLVDDSRTAVRARAAHERARGHHLYDHRVDALVEIARSTIHRQRPFEEPRDPLSVTIARDVEVTSVAVFGEVELTLPDREIRDGDAWLERGVSGRFDAAVVADGRTDLATVARATRRYLYLPHGGVAHALGDVRSVHPAATSSQHAGVTRIDTKAVGYRLPAGSGTP